MSLKLVSLIIPFYNSEKYIRTCVDSIKKQTYTDIEVIFIDDGSTDRSVAILSECADERFVVLQQEKLGVSAARNKGLNYAHGEFIAFMDVDDELEPNYLEVFVDAMEKTGAEIVLCNYYEEYVNGKRRAVELPWKDKLLTKDEIENVLLPDLISADSRGFSIMGVVWRIFIQKTFLKMQHCFFNEQLAIAEDLLFLIALFNRANRVYAASECLYVYKIRNSSTMNKYIPNRIEQILEIHKILVGKLKTEGLWERTRLRYYKYRTCMYTSELSNLSKNPNLLNSVRDLRRLREELIREPFSWKHYTLTKGRWISLWLLEHRAYVLLLVLYRLKEFIRLRGYLY